MRLVLSGWWWTPRWRLGDRLRSEVDGQPPLLLELGSDRGSHNPTTLSVGCLKPDVSLKEPVKVGDWVFVERKCWSYLRTIPGSLDDTYRSEDWMDRWIHLSHCKIEPLD